MGDKFYKSQFLLYKSSICSYRFTILGPKTTNQHVFSYESTIFGNSSDKKSLNFVSSLHLAAVPVFPCSLQVLEALKEKRTLPTDSQLADMAVLKPSGWWILSAPKLGSQEGVD